MADAANQSLGLSKQETTCCFGKIELRRGITILSTLTIILSVLFIAFEVFFRNVTPWWVWGGTITGVVGGLLGCTGAMMPKWYKLTLAYLSWAVLLCTWWGIFIIVMAIDFSKHADWINFWDMMWSIALFLWTLYTCYVIYKYYTSIKPSGLKWNTFGGKPPGYSAIE